MKEYHLLRTVSGVVSAMPVCRLIWIGALSGLIVGLPMIGTTIGQNIYQPAAGISSTSSRGTVYPYPTASGTRWSAGNIVSGSPYQAPDRIPNSGSAGVNNGVSTYASRSYATAGSTRTRVAQLPTTASPAPSSVPRIRSTAGSTAINQPVVQEIRSTMRGGTGVTPTSLTSPATAMPSGLTRVARATQSCCPPGAGVAQGANQVPSLNPATGGMVVPQTGFSPTPLTAGVPYRSNAYTPLLPLVAPSPQTYLGQGIIGQPTAYVDGQPLRNFLRYLAP